MILGHHHPAAGIARSRRPEWPLSTGDAFVIAPGEVVRFGEHELDAMTSGWCVFFPPEIIASEALGGSLGWKAHPLLFPFVGSGSRPVPATDNRATSTA